MEQYEYDQISSYKPYAETSYNRVRNIHNDMKQKKITNLIFKHPIYEKPEEMKEMLDPKHQNNNSVSEFATTPSNQIDQQNRDLCNTKYNHKQKHNKAAVMWGDVEI